MFGLKGIIFRVGAFMRIGLVWETYAVALFIASFGILAHRKALLLGFTNIDTRGCAEHFFYDYSLKNTTYSHKIN